MFNTYNILVLLRVGECCTLPALDFWLFFISRLKARIGNELKLGDRFWRFCEIKGSYGGWNAKIIVLARIFVKYDTIDGPKIWAKINGMTKISRFHIIVVFAIMRGCGFQVEMTD